MKCIRIHSFGGPEVLQFDEVAMPQPGEDEVLVKVHAASVNPVDYKIRSGAFLKVDALPVTMGRDVWGTIEAFGSRAKGLRKGDGVFAMLGHGHGGCAQFIALKPNEHAAKPRNLDHIQAAAVPLAAMTAWQGLFDHGHLAQGQRVLIHGGAGGVGHFAVQFAKARGAFVATTVSGEDIGFARDLGADLAIDYRKQRFEEAVSDIDLVFDLVAGDTQERSFNVLRDGGAMISTLKEPDQERAKARNLRTAYYMAQPDAAQLAEIAKLIEGGKVRPAVDTVFRFAAAPEAQAKLEHEHVRGKIVLEIG
ncbi:MAG: NADP-dependent oxidoreductase [Alphaproteobacteria bacterium]|nr:NADP-dependent oxidoreductase [Alphaproteobacteria bacterium]